MQAHTEERKTRAPRRKAHNVIDTARVRVWTEPHTDPVLGSVHRHVAVIDGNGNGWTEESRGHRHRVRWCRVLEASRHTHELSGDRY